MIRTFHEISRINLKQLLLMHLVSGASGGMVAVWLCRAMGLTCGR